MKRRRVYVLYEGDGLGSPLLDDIHQESNSVNFWMECYDAQPLSYSFDTRWFGPQVDYEDWGELS